MTLFRLDASILPSASASRSLADLVEQEWTSAHPDSAVTRRDLTADPIRPTAWPDAVIGAQLPEDQRTDAQREALALGDLLANELLEAEALLFAVPLYNYGPSQHFKTWFDLAYTVPTIDPWGTGLRGKPAVLVTAMGGNYSPGNPREGWDHSTPWLRRVFEDVWGLDLRVVQRPLSPVYPATEADGLTEVATTIKTEAETSARHLGRELAERRGSRRAA